MMGSPTQANAVLVLGRAEACVAFYCAKRNLCDRIAERDCPPSRPAVTTAFHAATMFLCLLVGAARAFPFCDIFIAVVCNSFFVNYVGIGRRHGSSSRAFVYCVRIKRGPRHKPSLLLFVMGRSGGIGRFNERVTLSRCDLIAEREDTAPQSRHSRWLFCTRRSSAELWCPLPGVFMSRPAYPDYQKHHTDPALKSPFPFKISLSRTFLPSKFAKVKNFS